MELLIKNQVPEEPSRRKKKTDEPTADDPRENDEDSDTRKARYGLRNKKKVSEDRSSEPAAANDEPEEVSYMGNLYNFSFFFIITNIFFLFFKFRIWVMLKTEIHQKLYQHQ